MRGMLNHPSITHQWFIVILSGSPYHLGESCVLVVTYW